MGFLPNEGARPCMPQYWDKASHFTPCYLKSHEGTFQLRPLFDSRFMLQSVEVRLTLSMCSH